VTLVELEVGLEQKLLVVRELDDQRTVEGVLEPLLIYIYIYI
jgi:hypothetical protein